MNTKIFFTVSALLNLAFGIGLLFMPATMTELYITDVALRNPLTDFLSQLFGGTLIGLAVGLFLARNSVPSTAKNGLIISAAIIQASDLIIHILSIEDGVQKPLGWTTAGISAVMLLWSLMLLKKQE